MSKTICDECGKELEIGDFPFCPHGKVPKYFNKPFVPYWDEHISPDGPIYITSHRQRTRELKRNNMDFRGRKSGMPGQEI